MIILLCDTTIKGHQFQLSQPGSMAQWVVCLTAGPWASSYSQLCYPEIISMVILPIPLIQEGQLSVSGKSIHVQSPFNP